MFNMSHNHKWDIKPAQIKCRNADPSHCFISQIHMKTYEDYFSINEIVDELCKERIKLADKRHEFVLNHRVSADQPPPEDAHQATAENLKEMFPPRRQWRNFRKSTKNRKMSNAHEVNVKALMKAARVLMRTNPDLPWVVKLRSRAEAIRVRALEDGNFGFSTPAIFGVPKKPGKHEYRPISIYPIDDKIIDKLTCRYLRDKLDFCFSPSSLAFRVRQVEQSRAVTHHDVLNQIVAFRKQYPHLYVTEADLKNFMDCVDHYTARLSLHNLIKQAKKLRQDFEISQRAIQIYDAYLASYSYKRDVLDQGLRMLKARDPHASFSWPEEILRRMHGGKDDLSEIGIPQGGALSCFVTNVILHDVDQAIEMIQKRGGPIILYLRYCDDMIILSPCASACGAAMDAFENGVGRKMLPIHPLVDMSGYQIDPKSKKGIWNLKSKKTYLWGSENEGGWPWIQFVGYQIRHDELVRIRLKSVKKHRQKLTDFTDEMLGIINPGNRSENGVPIYAPGLKMNHQQIEHVFLMKLISLSVGRRNFGHPLPACVNDIMPMCWTNGFRGLWGVRFVSTQLKELDRHRDRQLRRLRCRLKHLPAPDRQALDANGSNSTAPFYGAPFSYHSQFVCSLERLEKRKGLWHRIANFIQRLKAALRSRF